MTTTATTHDNDDGKQQEEEEDQQQVEFGTLAEQEDESFYDSWRHEDDPAHPLEENPYEAHIRFPTHKLYGRDKELQTLEQIVATMTTTTMVSSPAASIATPRQGPNVVFLSGYSGTGKKSLVQALVRKTRSGPVFSKSSPTSSHTTTTTTTRSSSKSISSDELPLFPNFIFGEFPRSTGGGRGDNPFAVISKALNDYLLELISQSDNNNNDDITEETILKTLGHCFLDQGILDPNSEDAQLLGQTLVPSLPQLLERLTQLVPLPKDGTNAKRNSQRSSISLSSATPKQKAKHRMSGRSSMVARRTSGGTRRGSSAMKRASGVRLSIFSLRRSSMERRLQQPHPHPLQRGRSRSMLVSVTQSMKQAVGTGGLSSSTPSIVFSANDGTERTSPSSSYNSRESMVVHRNWHVVQYSLIKLLRALTDFLSSNNNNKGTNSSNNAKQPLPLIWYLEDLQWMDKMSHELLQTVMMDKVLRRRILWIGSYLPNYDQTSQDDDGPFVEWKQHLEAGVQNPERAELGYEVCQYHHLPLSNLSPGAIGDFIADSLGIQEEEDRKEISPITQAVYSKTLGNMFFVRQALLELERRNAIYYDVMTFTWKFVGDGLDEILVDCLSQDVGEMIQAKLQALPVALQLSLTVAAYCNHSFDTEWLYPLVKTQYESYQMRRSQHGGNAPDDDGTDDLSTVDAFEKLMYKAFQDGLILRDQHSNTRSSCTLCETQYPKSSETYKFVHDRMREAARASIPEGEERNLFLLDLAMSLLQQAERETVANKVAGRMVGDKEWMLFAASDHLNSLPSSLVNIMQVSELSLRVGTMATSKGCFSNGLVYFRSSIERLVESKLCWEDPYYELSLKLHNHLLECEHVLGNIEGMEAVIQQVYSHARTEPDKLHAQYFEVYSKRGLDNDRYTECVDAGLRMLSQYGIDIPANPTEKHLASARMKMTILLRGRSIAAVSKFPISTDPELVAPLKLAQITLGFAALCNRHTVMALLSRRILMLVLIKKGITMNLPFVIGALAGPFRREERYEKMADYLSTFECLLDRFSHENGTKEFLLSKFNLYTIFTCLQTEFHDTIPIFVQLTRDLIAIGEVDPGLGAGMQSILSPFLTALPVQLLEPRLVRLAEIATNLRKRSFVVFFSMMRQFLFNLQGGTHSSSNPTVFDGDIFDEMSGGDAAAKKHHSRDTFTFRLLLAVIFDDELAMDEMIEKLDAFPVFDAIVLREHIRMCFVGLASLILGRKTDLQKKWATKCMRYFEKLTRYGSPNAEPVYICFQALSKPSAEAFEDAIDVLDGLAMVHLSAIMNERYAIWQIAKRPDKLVVFDEDEPSHVDYLKRSIGLFNEWGARAKVDQMHEKYSFLPTTMEESSSSLMFKAISRQCKRNSLDSLPASIGVGTI